MIAQLELSLEGKIEQNCAALRPRFRVEEMRVLYLSGLSCSEVAKQMGLNKGSVYGHLHDIGITSQRKIKFVHPKEAEIRGLYESGLTCQQVADKLGMTASCVNQNLRRIGIKGRMVGGKGRIHPKYVHPKDAEIKALYLTGKGYREIGQILGLGRGGVHHSCQRQGINRAPIDRLAGKENEIIALAKTGVGWKAIGRRLGINGNSRSSIRTLLKKHGINAHWKNFKEQAAHRVLDNTFIPRSYPCFEEPTMKPKKSPAEKSRDYYYSNHIANKAKAGVRAYTRYWTFEKGNALAQAKRNLRRIVSRIARNVSIRRAMRKENVLGCSYDDARLHIASQFKQGWAWSNHGLLWEIDHIRPLISFSNLLDPVQFREAAHYTNYRPIECGINRSNGRKQRAMYATS